MPDNRPINRPLDADDDLLTDDMEPIPYDLVDGDADASAEDHLAEQTDNSGESLAEADDVPQAPDGVELVDDDDTDDDLAAADGE